jgi:polyhydroxyalkanoate synthase
MMIPGAMDTMNMMPTSEDIAQAWQGFTHRMAAMPKVVNALQSVKKGVTPSDVVHTDNKLNLLHYKPQVKQKHNPPIIFAFALVNRPYILDLLPGKSVVEHFVKAGFDVYLIDWGVPSAADKHMTVDDYVNGQLHRCVEYVSKASGCDKVNLLGYCMGGSMTAMYAALHPGKVRNLIQLAAPVDWSDTEGLLSLWCREDVFDIDAFLDAFGNAPPWWLQQSFQMLKPVSNMVEKYLGFYERMEDEKFLGEFFAMETWVNDNIPVAGETFRTFVKDCFQQNKLIKGELVVGGRRVDLGDIVCPVLNLMAKHDHLVPCGQSRTLNDVIGSKDRKSIIFDAGHIGMAVGSKSNRELWPQVCDWLGERCEGVK